MPEVSRLSSRLWWLLPLAACSFLVLADVQRARRVLDVTNTDREAAVVDPASSTGYADGKRWLIVPEHHSRSYQWIAETQQMLARGEWRVRRIDSENAPFGREVHAPSPYRWWIGTLAWLDHQISGRPLGIAVERAALWADPLLHGLLLVLTTVAVARWFGRWSAAAFAGGSAALYPFAGAYLPGVLHDRGLAAACALWSVLPLLAALRAGGNRRAQHRLMALAGVAGGIGLWVGTAQQLIVVAGIACGALLGIALNARRDATPAADSDAPLPWLTWTTAGAATSLAAYFVEYFPAQIALRLEVNHPVHGLAWLGCGQIIASLEAWSRRRRAFWTFTEFARLAAGSLAVATLPVAMAATGASVFAGELADSRLVHLPRGPVAASVAAWVARDGLSMAAAAIGLCYVLLGLGAWQMLRERQRETRTMFAIAFGAAVGAAALASARLAWWQMAAALLLALVVVAFAELRSAAGRRVWVTLFGSALLVGLVPLVPRGPGGGNIELTPVEAEALLERELAHWLADRAPVGGAVVLAPPARTVRWCFHGGLRGLGSANWENREGLAATVRIVTATSADEAHALLVERGVTHLVLPSWDEDLDAFARWSLSNPSDAFIMALRHWAAPTWLRPLPYRLPDVPGLEPRSVAIFAVTEDANRAAAASRLAEYFVEMGDLDRAAVSREALRRYPTDLGALVALARVEKARGDTAAFGQTLETLQSSVTNGLDRTLPWDRRVSLAVVLALGGRTELAREQVRRCVAQVDADRLRLLTTGSLFQLLVLAKNYEHPIADPAMRQLALRLLPPELRERF